MIHIYLKYLVPYIKASNDFCLEFCEMKFKGQITSEKLKRDLTSKCGEERRKMEKKCSNSNMDKVTVSATTCS